MGGLVSAELRRSAPAAVGLRTLPEGPRGPVLLRFVPGELDSPPVCLLLLRVDFHVSGQQTRGTLQEALHPVADEGLKADAVWLEHHARCRMAVRGHLQLAALHLEFDPARLPLPRHDLQDSQRNRRAKGRFPPSEQILRQVRLVLGPSPVRWLRSAPGGGPALEGLRRQGPPRRHIALHDKLFGDKHRAPSEEERLHDAEPHWSPA
mmetsp:Transcript_106015/g.207944  ORF Transcript_106015/g.207944 Transcript_106015/m.207944 type:complete len:207 (-) Transcript_106015:476-1096(-)